LPCLPKNPYPVVRNDSAPGAAKTPIRITVTSPYLQQQERGWRRKRELLAESGAKCGKCGYARNLAALVWHHLDPAGKSFSLDIRSLSNRSETEIRREMGKCVVLCANCHAETHHPQFDVAILQAATNEPALRRVRSSKVS
jgi:hypothetical protein